MNEACPTSPCWSPGLDAAPSLPYLLSVDCLSLSIIATSREGEAQTLDIRGPC